jgi:hypothetical protein
MAAFDLADDARLRPDPLRGAGLPLGVAGVFDCAAARFSFGGAGFFCGAFARVALAFAMGAWADQRLASLASGRAIVAREAID